MRVGRGRFGFESWLVGAAAVGSSSSSSGSSGCGWRGEAVRSQTEVKSSCIRRLKHGYGVITNAAGSGGALLNSGHDETTAVKM